MRKVIAYILSNGVLIEGKKRAELAQSKIDSVDYEIIEERSYLCYLYINSFEYNWGINNMPCKVRVNANITKVNYKGREINADTITKYKTKGGSTIYIYAMYIGYDSKIHIVGSKTKGLSLFGSNKVLDDRISVNVCILEDLIL